MQTCCAQQVETPAARRALSGIRRSETVLSGHRLRASPFRTRRLVLAVLSAALFVAAEVVAQPASGADQAVSVADLSRIRTNDLGIAWAVRRGYDASPTLQQIIQKLQRANVIVYLDRHNRFRNGEAAHLRFAGSASGLRYVRVSLNTRLTDRQLTVFVAHELMHAVEIAADERVVDQKTLKQLYCRIGSLGQRGFDTEAARRVTEQVSDELDHPGFPDR